MLDPWSEFLPIFPSNKKQRLPPRLYSGATPLPMHRKRPPLSIMMRSLGANDFYALKTQILGVLKQLPQPGKFIPD